MAKFKTYSITNDTLNSKLNMAALHQEMLLNATIGPIFDGINSIQGSDNFDCYLITERTTEIDTAMDLVVSNHTGTPLEEINTIQINSQPAFAAKTLPDGKKLFRRKHGISSTILANSSGIISFTVPYNQAKINKAEIINCSNGDTVNLTVHDTTTGTYTTVPNYQLNQFGFNVQMPDGMYKDESQYDADLLLNMVVKIEYTNNTNSDKLIGVNITLHEVV